MRLLTRADFDGLVCAVLLEEKGIVNGYLFVHPKDIQDGKIKPDANDVLANIPYAPGCGLWFDHHAGNLEDFRLKGGDLTILVSTPYMDEAERCDRVALVQNGKLLSVDTPARIREDFRPQLWAVRAGDMYRLKHDLAGYHAMRSVFLFGQDLHVTLEKDDDAGGLRDWLRDLGHREVLVQRIQPGVEDCFMELMSNKQLEES